jgi:hypothetical protein
VQTPNNTQDQQELQATPSDEDSARSSETLTLQEDPFIYLGKKVLIELRIRNGKHINWIACVIKDLSLKICPDLASSALF